jgi:outer membrane receptor protein involved in Fe transport
MKTTYDTRRARTLIAGALLVALCTSAVRAADTTADPGGASATPTGTADAENIPQEVVVTATHISQGVNHIPITISAVTQDDLDKKGITDASSLAAAVPGLQAGNGVAGKQTFTIRGIGSSVGAATTGVYLDDTSLTQFQGAGVDQSNGAPVPEFFDLERVEVLEGPQGTLYGGSSEGGTVRFITPTPSLTQYSAYGRAQIEDTRYGSSGHLYGVAGGGPIIDNQLGVRASVVEHKTGGWLDIYNPYSTGVAPDSDIAPNNNWSDEFAARVSALWQIADNSTLQLNYYHHQNYLNATLGGPTEPLAPGQVFTTPQTCFNTAAAKVGGGAPPKVACPPAGSPLAAGVHLLPAQTTGPFPFLNGTDAVVVGNAYLNWPPSSQLTKMQVPSITFTQDFGRISFKSISSYVRNETEAFFIDRNVGGRALGVTQYPGTATYPLDPGDPDYTGISQANNGGNTVSQEFRLSDPGSADSRWSWVGGLYYSRSRLSTSYDLFTPTNETTEFLYGISSYEYFGIPDQPNNRTGTYRLHVTNTEEAAYGNVNFKVTDKLKVTGGVRISSIEQNFYQLNFGQESQDTADSPLAAASGSIHNVPVAPLANVQYNFTPDDMVYASGSKGFRSGGVNIPLNAFACAAPLQLYGLTVADIPKTYGPDEVWSYELGTKMRMLDQRMQFNLSAFWINWSGIQSAIPTPPGCNTGWTENGGKAVSRGADLQVQYRPIDAFDIDMKMQYDDAYYAQQVQGPTPLNGSPATVVIEKGQKFNVPNFTGVLGTQYNFALFGHTNFVRTDWQYQGAYQAGTPYPLSGFTPYDNFPAWFLLNLRAGVNFNWGDVQIYANNALNRQAWNNPQNAFGQSSFGGAGCSVSGGPNCNTFITFSPFVSANVPVPRVVGIQFDYTFK